MAKTSEKTLPKPVAVKAPAKGDHVFLVDGSSYIFRAYHALPPLNRKSDGLQVNAVLGFCNMLWKLLRDMPPDNRPTHLAIIFDKSEITFRNKLYPDYKAHRPPAPDDLIPQFPLIREAVRAFDLPCLEQAGFEADDLIATYVRLACERGASATIVSSDKDLMQLVTDCVTMYDTMKDRRIGIAEEARISRQLVLLDDKVKLDVPLDELAVHEPDARKLIAFLKAMEFSSLTRRVAEYSQIDPADIEADAGSKSGASVFSSLPLAEKVDELGNAPDGDLFAGQSAPPRDQVEGKPSPASARGSAPGKTGGGKEDKAGSNKGTPISLATARAEAARKTKIDRSKYQTIRSLEELRWWIARVHDVGHFAIEAKANSVDPMQAEICGIALALGANDAAYVPLGHKQSGDGSGLFAAGLAPEQIKADDALEALRPLLESAGILKIGFNIKFNAVMFAQAAEDADVILRLWQVLKPRLVAERMTSVYETLERPLISVLARMERRGISIDRQVLSRLSGEFAQTAARVEAEIQEIAGEPINVGSPKQIGDILFGKMAIPGGSKTKTGAWSTSAQILDELAEQGHEFPKKILEWRQVSKLKSTYTDALPTHVHPQTHRVHTTYALAATTTGRLSSNEPNLQNIPVRSEDGRKIRRAFIASPGHKLVSADYSQIELRLLAEIADIPVLKQAFKDGLDIHAMTASEMFGVPIKDMPGEVRRRAKAINFGIIYGISAFGLANQLGIAREEASAYIKKYFERFPGIRAYMDQTRDFCRAHGYVETLFGRKCHYPDIKASNASIRSFNERAAINARLQGTAADIIRRAMIRMEDALAEKKLSAQMLLQVHDELIFEVPDDEVAATLPVVQHTMQDAPFPAVLLSVPLHVDARAADNWDEAH